MSNLIVEIDNNGYPTDETLESIKHYHGSAEELLKGLQPAFEQYGICRWEGAIWVLITGGWSGCESIIYALQENLLFWSLCWESSHNGGKYTFGVDGIDLIKVKSKSINKPIICAGQSPKSGLDCRMSTRCKHNARFKDGRDLKDVHVHTLLNDSINERCGYFDEIEEEE